MKRLYSLLLVLVSGCTATANAVGDPVPWACTMLQKKLCGHCAKDGGSSCWIACVRKHAKELRKVCKLTPLEQNEQIDEAHGAADIAKAAQWERPGGAFSDPNLQSAASLGLSSEEYDDLDVMPGADFMMKGFDVTNDSVSLYVSNGGETQRLPVYKFTYDNQATYTNPYTKVKYKVADQISPTTNTQAMEFIVQDISYHFSSVQTYETSRFNIGVKFSSENINAGVTYNHQMAKASTIMSNNSHVFAGSKKWWKIFDIAGTHRPPHLCMPPRSSAFCTLVSTYHNIIPSCELINPPFPPFPHSQRYDERASL